MLGPLRNFGHCINPVVFYYCYDAQDTRVQTIVAEITSTPWRERHSYVLPVAMDCEPGTAMRFDLEKDFHVSPFMPMAQDYAGTRPSGGTPGRAMGTVRRIQVFDATLSPVAPRGALRRWRWCCCASRPRPALVAAIHWRHGGCGSNGCHPHILVRPRRLSRRVAPGQNPCVIICS